MTKLMKSIIFGLFMSVLCIARAHAGTFPAASCNQSDVASAINMALAAGSGNTVTIPPGTCTWSTSLTTPASGIMADLTILGAGNANCPASCDDATRINFNGARWYVLPSAGGTVHIKGLTISSTGTVQYGVIILGGPGPGAVSQVRLDHFHSIMTGNGDTAFVISEVVGVLDHSLFDQPTDSTANAIKFYYPLNDNGDQSWANPTNLGSTGFMYVEDNIFNQGVANDGQEGARFVFRFNTMNNASVQTHPTGGAGRGRGARAWEIYKNTFQNPDATSFNAFFLSSGTGVVWGNTVTGSQWSNFLTIHSMRRSNSTYPQAAAPNGWGYCGTSFNGTGSNWDQNTNAGTGYRCLDQPGMGRGDLLTGDFPNVTNAATGCTASSACASPREAVEPVYEWQDNFGGSAFLANYSTDVLFNNADYYLWCNPSSRSGCTSFNGTVGVGSGTLASRPATCTAGVAYWATDQGNWNTSGSGEQGVLYKCTSANTWTLFYTPYTYPHPLEAAGTAPSAPIQLQGVVK